MMLAITACLFGIFIILVIAEVLADRKVLKGEYLRKFVHIAAGSFIAFWPWLISWHWIQLLALAMIIVTTLNHYFSFFSYHGHRASYGDIFLAIAILLVAGMTDNKIFFCLAILEVALADGLAALAGITYGKKWGYKVFNHRKTVIGSMVFWLTTLCIFGIGLLPTSNIISFHDYVLILIFAPPAFTLVENLSVFGLDNLIIPILTLVVLKMAQA